MFTLKVSQLEKSFGSKTVFSNLSFRHGEHTLGIAGANGSGKSTFLKCLSYLLRPTRGYIEWQQDGEPLNKVQFKKKLGYAAPYIGLYDELSCRENLSFLAKARHQSAANPTIEEWIHKVGLDRVADQPFGKISTGQQQRLRLASALFHEPEILLLDEPGSNLDDAGRELIIRIVETFKNRDKQLIIASNNQQELELCNHIFSIEQESFA